MRLKKYPIPVLDSAYVPVFRPKGDVYRGENTLHFRNGAWYDTWIVNDFSVLYAENAWHLIGITHPKPDDFVDAFAFSEPTVHEAEWQLFHAVAKGGDFSSVFFEDSFTELEKILYPADRPGEANEIWAPCLSVHNGLYELYYSPDPIRLAVSDDLLTWRPQGALFHVNEPSARDPFVFTDDGLHYMIYVTANRLEYRVSKDRRSWSKAKVLQVNPYVGACSESPFLWKKDGIYYLIWSIYDGRNGCYDERAFVFAADTLDGLKDIAPLTILPGHAPEILQGADADYILSVFYPENGVSAARLRWV